MGKRIPAAGEVCKKIPADGAHKLTAAEVLARYSENYPDFCDPLTDVNQVGTFGNSYQGDVEAMQALVEGGAEINVSGDMGSTPLHDAVQGGHLEAVQFLLEHGADPNVKDEFGHTPLDWASLEGRPEVIELLKKNKSDRVT
jgi:ankyrin repeat protein